MEVNDIFKIHIIEQLFFSSNMWLGDQKFHIRHYYKKPGEDRLYPTKNGIICKKETLINIKNKLEIEISKRSHGNIRIDLITKPK